MGQPVTLQDDFSGGFWRDAPRHRLPRGKAWYMRDFLPGLDGALRKRGGWSYASPDLSTVTAGSAFATHVHSSNVTGSHLLVAIDEDDNVFKVTSPASASNIGTFDSSDTNICSALGRIIFTSRGDTPKGYNGTTLAALSGSPPAGEVGVGFGSYLVIGSTVANPNRIYFSAPGNSDSWDTTNSYLDLPSWIRGLATMPGMLLVFQKDRVDAVIGSTPPPGGDFYVRPLWEGGGAQEQRNIASSQGIVAWASKSGIYVTDGASVSDLTKLAGIKNYWPTIASDTSNPIGIFRGYLFGGSQETALMIDIEERSVFGWSFTGAANPSYYSTNESLGEMYSGHGGLPRVVSYSSMFSPSGSVKADADGDSVTPYLETPFYEFGTFRQKRYKDLYLTYDLRDAASDNPTLTGTYVDSPEETSYSAFPTAMTFAETTELTRTKKPIRLGKRGLGLKIAQTNASSDTYIYSIEAEGYGTEPSR